MDQDTRELMDSAARCEHWLRVHGQEDAARIMRRLILEVSVDEDIISRQECTRKILNKELKALKAAATEQTRIIRELRKEAGYHG